MPRLNTIQTKTAGVTAYGASLSLPRMLLFGVLCMLIFFRGGFSAALVCVRTALAPTAATAALMRKFFIYYYSHNRRERHRNGDYYTYIERRHYSSACLFDFFFLLNIFTISNTPIFLKTIKVTITAITPSQINSVHHQLPTVYTIAETR